MSTDKPTKKTRSTKTKADLEAKIAELEAKLNSLAAQAKPAETKPTPPPAPKPQVQQKPEPKPEIQQKSTVPKPEGQKPKAEVAQSSSSSTQEVASAYANTSSSGYTGNRYYATRQRLAYHPPDKQFTGQVTVQVSRPAPPAPEPEPVIVEPEPQKQKEEPRRIEPPTPIVKYTGENYYRTRQRLAYHPPDKQFIETVAVKFEEPPKVSQVESTTSQSTSSSQKKSRNEELEEYERDYLERLKQQRVEVEEPEPVVSEKSPHGTMPAGW
ncbi:MAG: hypothetical protein ACT4N5_00080, partial [Nitrosopumilaceae archaeon]